MPSNLRPSRQDAFWRSLGSRHDWLPDRNEALQFLTTFGLATVGLLAVLRADVHYIDDIGRDRAFYDWADAGRPIAGPLYRLIAGGYIFDISPFSQLLGLAATAAAAHVVVVQLLQVRRRVEGIAASLLIVLSPYGLEIHAYRYDSMLYAIALLLTVGAIFILRRSTGIGAIASGALLIGASYGIFPPMAGIGLVLLGLIWCADFVRMHRVPKELPKLMVIVVGLHLSGMATMAAVASRMPLSAYTLERSTFTAAHLGVNVWRGGQAVLALIVTDWSRSPIGIAFLALLTIAPIVVLIRSAVVASTNRPQDILGGIALASVPVVLFLTFALGTLHVQLILDQTPMMARCFTGFGFLLAGAVALLCLEIDKRPARVLRVAIGAISIVLVVWLISLASLFGNLLSSQDRYARAMAMEMFTAFQALRADDSGVQFAAIDGVIMRPPPNALVYRVYPMMMRIVPVYTDFNAFWTSRFFEAQGARLPYDATCRSDAWRTGREPPKPTASNANFDVYVVGPCAIFSFKPVSTDRS